MERSKGTGLRRRCRALALGHPVHMWLTPKKMVFFLAASAYRKEFRSCLRGSSQFVVSPGARASSAAVAPPASASNGGYGSGVWRPRERLIQKGRSILKCQRESTV